MQVFILLFNARTDNEGIHTLKVSDPSDDSGLSRDVVLAFEAEDDATRFALLLEAQDFPDATVEKIDIEEIEGFCQSADLDFQLVPEGTLAVPPEISVEQTDWQPDGKVDDQDSAQVPNTPELDRIRQQLEKLL
jgi:hypothetical protein